MSCGLPGAVPGKSLGVQNISLGCDTIPSLPCLLSRGWMAGGHDDVPHTLSFTHHSLHFSITPFPPTLSLMYDLGVHQMISQ